MFVQPKVKRVRVSLGANIFPFLAVMDLCLRSLGFGLGRHFEVLLSSKSLLLSQKTRISFGQSSRVCIFCRCCPNLLGSGDLGLDFSKRRYSE